MATLVMMYHARGSLVWGQVRGCDLKSGGLQTLHVWESYLEDGKMPNYRFDISIPKHHYIVDRLEVERMMSNVQMLQSDFSASLVRIHYHFAVG